MSEAAARARVVSGAYKEREGVLLPYPGLWVHIVFEDKGKPREAYLPQSAVVIRGGKWL